MAALKRKKKQRSAPSDVWTDKDKCQEGQTHVFFSTQKWYWMLYAG